ncbi:MAG: zinc ABC transporter substrate-binding protein [Candidatus Ancillula trichonymphae]|jgi:zinc/manganese transport system substrate-binding protein|nr:zinc ABC transporter substrate-binding protein [Candidatus Ancillula trichonymphae]
MKRVYSFVPLFALIFAGSVLFASCGNKSATDASSSCEEKALNIVVSVNQWKSPVEDVVGKCGKVSVIISGTDVDPHDYEPSPSVVATIKKADVLVVNGVDYDSWASKSAGESTHVFDIAKKADVKEGDNPHLWYNPQVYKKLSAGLEEELKILRPESDKYFKEQVEKFDKKVDQLLQKVEDKKKHLSGKKFVASESVANYLAKAIGPEDATPEGYANATANEGEPSANDVAKMHEVLTSGQAQFFFYNTQEENNLTKDLLADAQKSGIKILKVTEQCPSNFSDTINWITSVVDSLD